MPSKSNYLNKGLDFTKQSEIHETIRAKWCQKLTRIILQQTANQYET